MVRKATRFDMREAFAFSARCAMEDAHREHGTGDMIQAAFLKGQARAYTDALLTMGEDALSATVAAETGVDKGTGGHLEDDRPIYQLTRNH